MLFSKDPRVQKRRKRLYLIALESGEDSFSVAYLTHEYYGPSPTKQEAALIANDVKCFVSIGAAHKESKGVYSIIKGQRVHRALSPNLESHKRRVEILKTIEKASPKGLSTKELSLLIWGPSPSAHQVSVISNDIASLRRNGLIASQKHGVYQLA